MELYYFSAFAKKGQSDRAEAQRLQEKTALICFLNAEHTLEIFFCVDNHANLSPTTRNWPFSVLDFWDKNEHRICAGVMPHRRDFLVATGIQAFLRLKRGHFCVAGLRLAWISTQVFNEKIVCDGPLGEKPLEVKILVGGQNKQTIAGKGLVAACHDNVLTISRTDAGTDVDVARGLPCSYFFA